MPKHLKILIVHNHYQQRGGEDSVFETECKMLEDAGHTVIRYEKHNDEIGGEKGLGARGQGSGEKQLRITNYELRIKETKVPHPLTFPQTGHGVSPSETTPYSLLPTPSDKPPRLRGEDNPESKPFAPSRLRVSLLHSLRTKLALFCNTIWNRTTYREITEIIQREKPDIVHCHNTFPLISPSVYWAAAKQGVPVVQTLHNYRMTCLNGYLFREKHICERCLGHSPLPGIIHRCYRGSFAASFTVATMLMVHRALGTYRNKVTTYIALTEFARQKFIAAGLPADKIVVKPNAISSSSFVKTTEEEQLRITNYELRIKETPESRDGLDKVRDKVFENPTSSFIPHPSSFSPTVLYVGRLSPEKGVDVLIRAWAIFIARWTTDHATTEPGTESAVSTGSGVPPAETTHYALRTTHSLPQLHIIGDERIALELLANGIPNIKFLGSIPHADIAPHMHSATVLVMPSIWYEQFAITPLEAMIQGTPVIVSDCSKHSTIIENKKSGFVFKAGNPDSLSDIIIRALSDTNQLHAMATNAQITVTASLCMCDKNIQSLYDIYCRKCDKR